MASNPLQGMTVLDEGGQPIQLHSLWQEQPIVLAFVRHFGWMFCQEQVLQLRDAMPRIEEAGARLVVVGNGKASFIEGFRDKTGYQGELYTDPSRATYRALRLRRGLRSSVNLSTVKRAVEAMRDGHRQTATRGDPWQQGGVFIIDIDGAMLYRYPSEYAGDHPPVDEIVAAISRSQVVGDTPE